MKEVCDLQSSSTVLFGIGKILHIFFFCFFAVTFFDITDSNKDVVYSQSKNGLIVRCVRHPVARLVSMLVKQWAKFDNENVGYLTKDQAINRKA